MKPIFEMNEPVYELGILKLEVEYSGGENDNELEFETIRVSEENNLSPKDLRKAEKYLESGLEEDLVRKLAKEYEGTDITFIPNHYVID